MEGGKALRHEMQGLFCFLRLFKLMEKATFSCGRPPFSFF